MSIINFPTYNRANTGPSIVFCIIDKVSEYPTAYVRELVKNSADFEISKIHSFGFDVMVGYDEDQLLVAASDTHDYAVLIAVGNVFADNLGFYPLVREFCATQDFFILGHILDKQEAYYELHDQCSVFNLKYLKQLGYPEIGKRSLGSRHEQIQPHRSDDNYHDDYTPKWIKKGSTQRSYSHKLRGWNIISAALENDLNLIVFDSRFRDSKKYLYPDNNTEILERLSEFYLEHNIASRNWFNPFSTADSINLGPDLPGPLKYLVIPSVGLDFVHYLDHHGFDKNTKVRFTDYNLLSLEFMKLITEWDGEDYPLLVERFAAEKSQFLDLPTDVWVGIKQGIDDKWSQLKAKYPWHDLWNRIRSEVSFEFRYKDFLHYEGPRGKDKDYWIDAALNDPCTLVSLNHVFNYHSTSVFYTLKYRVEMENYTLENMKKLIPEAHLFFDDRSWRGFRKYGKKSLMGKVRDIETVDMKHLIRPTWHYNDDWNE
jgi:hypothetical protein